MFVLDTNIWLERLLGNAQSAHVGRLLDALAIDEMRMTDFTLHSIGVILSRLGHRDVFVTFVQDVLVDVGVTLITVPSYALHRVVAMMDQHTLDFDDAYQYVAAEREDATLVSLDAHFDATPRSRQPPHRCSQPYHKDYCWHRKGGHYDHSNRNAR